MANTQLFFSGMILLFVLGMAFANYKDKRALMHLLVLGVFSVILINLNYWFCLIGIVFLLFLMFYKKISQPDAISLSMLGYLLGSFFAISLFQSYEIAFLRVIISIALVIMCVLSVLGIFEKRIIRFFSLASMIYLLFVVFDLGVSKAAGSSDTAMLQILDYAVAGSLFFIAIVLLNKDNAEQFKDIQGAYYKDHVVGVLAIISCLALAGLPGFNVFVGKWFLLTKAFTIDPAISIIEILMALLLLLMYFKVVYVLIATYAAQKQKAPMLPKVYAILLGVLCLVFGLVPYLQLYIINKVIG